MIKQLSLLLLLITSACYTAAAGSPTLRLKGSADMQAGYYTHTESQGAKNVSAYYDRFGLYNGASFYGDASNDTESGVTYGARIGINTSARSMRNTSSFMYFISDYGKLELGSYKSAMNVMKITGYSNACATAGLWDTWMKTDPANRGGIYITNTGGFVDQKTRNLHQTEFARKVTYYTPELKNFQFGISYIPDTSNVGYAPVAQNTEHNPSKMKEYNANIKDGVAVGISHHYDFNDDTKIRSSIVGEKGKTVQNFALNNNMVKLSNLKAYSIGSELTYKQFSIAGSYGNYMKSLTSPVVNTLGRNTSVWTAGGRYDFENNVACSLTYFESRHYSNKLQAATAATEYKIMEGVRPYAEFTYYRTSGRIKDITTNAVLPDSHRGTVTIIGTTIEF